jgi:glycosyltransferase involved in cell wall biosynthesis
VTVIAQGEGLPQVDDWGIKLMPTGTFGRMSRRRWLASLWLIALARQQAADAYIVHSPELLLTGYWLKRLTGARILYDVHEDFAANLRHGAHWPAWLRRLLARLARAWERWAVRHWVDGVCYAEACYVNQLHARPGQSLLLENAFMPPAEPSTVAVPSRPYLLYSGTIAEAWGLWEALDLWEAWQQHVPIDLVIAGHTHHPALLAQLHRRVQASGYAERFVLFGGEQYLPYADMMALMQGCEGCLALYHDLPQIRNKMPTKFFEAMACGKPLIFTPQPAWLARNQTTPLGFPWQPGDEVGRLTEALPHWQAPDLPRSTYVWTSQEPVLAQALTHWLDAPPTHRRKH